MLVSDVMGSFVPVRQAGNIAEAVVWESGASKRHLIADRALAYALTRHLGQDTTVSGCAGLLDAAMTRRHASPDDLAAARRCLSRCYTGQLHHHAHPECMLWKTCSPCCSVVIASVALPCHQGQNGLL